MNTWTDEPPLSPLRDVIKDSIKKLNERCTVIDRHRERKSTLIRVKDEKEKEKEKKKTFKFGGTKVEEIAQQLTQWEHHLYSSIPYQELHESRWLRDSAPFIQFLLTWFDNVVRWLTFEILDAPTKDERVGALCRVISLGWKMRSLSNYSGVMQVLCCLHSLPVARLTSCWSSVPPSERREREREGEEGSRVLVCL